METHLAGYEPLVSLGLALAVGLLIGFEREQSATADGGPPAYVGGARTYPLVALVAAVASLLSRPFGVGVLLVAFAGLCAFLVIAYLDNVRREHDHGLTSEVAVILTFLLGALATTEGVVEPLSRRVLVLLGVAVVVSIFLSIKPRLHDLLHHATRQDVYATLKFLLVTIVVLPLLPGEPIPYLEGITPFRIGLMVVLIATVGFVGYVLVRALGAGRGLVLTGLVGGLVSSTAVTLSSAARAREHPHLAGACALAVVSASAVMFARVVAIVAVAHPPLVPSLALPLGLMGLVAAVTTFVSWRRAGGAPKDGEVAVRNPFELGSALKFGLLFVVVLVISKMATRHFGAGGSYFAGLLAGTTDVDAITLSMAELAKGGLETNVAVTTIVLGAASNTIVKGALAATLGGWALGRRVLLSFALTILAGAAGLVVLWVRAT